MELSLINGYYIFKRPGANSQTSNKPAARQWNSAKIEEKKGYCIHTGEEIPFNLKKPYTSRAYNTWSQYSNRDYAERFCHYSGEPSNGETSFANPVLRKNWRKAKEEHKF